MQILKKIKGSYWLRSGSFKMFERVSLVVFNFASFYLLVRNTTQTDFGTWTLYVSIGSYLELLRHGFISKGIMKCIGQSASSDEYAKVETSALLINMGITVLGSLLIFFGSPYIAEALNAPKLESLLKIYSGLNFLMIVFYHIDVMQQANMDFKASSFGQFTYKGVQFLLIAGYLLLVSDVKLETLAWLQGAAVLCGTVVIFFMGKSKLSGRFLPDRAALSELFHFGKWTFGTNANAILLRNIDSWFLSAIIGPSAVAIYSIAIKVSTVLEIPINVLSSIMFPKMVQRIRENGVASVKYMYEKSVATITALLLPIVVVIMLLADYIVLLIGDERYDASGPILQITVFYSILMALNKQIGVLLDASGKEKLNFLFVLRNMLINVVLNYFMINEYGVIGAALATLSTFVISMLINQWYINRAYKINPANYFKFMIEVYSQGGQFIKKLAKKQA